MVAILNCVQYIYLYKLHVPFVPHQITQWALLSIEINFNLTLLADVQSKPKVPIRRGEQNKDLLHVW